MEINKKRNTKAIVSLIVSCISVLNCCMWYLAILFAVVGIVLGILALREDNKAQQDVAVAGIVVGGVGLSLGIVTAVLYIMLFSATGDGSLQNAPVDTDTVMMLVRRIML